MRSKVGKLAWLKFLNHELRDGDERGWWITSESLTRGWFDWWSWGWITSDWGRRRAKGVTVIWDGDGDGERSPNRWWLIDLIWFDENLIGEWGELGAVDGLEWVDVLGWSLENDLGGERSEVVWGWSDRSWEWDGGMDLGFEGEEDEWDRRRGELELDWWVVGWRGKLKLMTWEVFEWDDDLNLDGWVGLLEVMMDEEFKLFYSPHRNPLRIMFKSFKLAWPMMQKIQSVTLLLYLASS